MSHLAGILAGKHFAQKDVPSLVGRKYIVTGGQFRVYLSRVGRDLLAHNSGGLRAGTNGIGLSAARCLYSHGADVTIIGSQQVGLLSLGFKSWREQEKLISRVPGACRVTPMPPSSTSEPATCTPLRKTTKTVSMASSENGKTTRPTADGRAARSTPRCAISGT